MRPGSFSGNGSEAATAAWYTSGACPVASPAGASSTTVAQTDLTRRCRLGPRFGPPCDVVIERSTAFSRSAVYVGNGIDYPDATPGRRSRLPIGLAR